MHKMYVCTLFDISNFAVRWVGWKWWGVHANCFFGACFQATTFTHTHTHPPSLQCVHVHVLSCKYVIVPMSVHSPQSLNLTKAYIALIKKNLDCINIILSQRRCRKMFYTRWKGNKSFFSYEIHFQIRWLANRKSLSKFFWFLSRFKSNPIYKMFSFSIFACHWTEWLISNQFGSSANCRVRSSISGSARLPLLTHFFAHTLFCDAARMSLYNISSDDHPLHASVGVCVHVASRTCTKLKIFSKLLLLRHWQRRLSE